MKKFPEPQVYSTQPRPQIDLFPVESSQIDAVGYDSATETLAIRFKNGTGAIYHYPKVTAAVHESFIASESLGKFFGTNIKPMAFDKFPPEPVL